MAAVHNARDSRHPRAVRDQFVKSKSEGEIRTHRASKPLERSQTLAHSIFMVCPRAALEKDTQKGQFLIVNVSLKIFKKDDGKFP